MESSASLTSIVEASIEELQNLLSTGTITSVDLVAGYLHRISTYDCKGLSLNAIPILNENVFEEAAASDARRAEGLPIRPLEGIPYTVKDSYKVKGMTVASGSPAFENLLSNEDAFAVQMLREAGAVLIGKTNMPPMAAGGMQRGVYGRAESPYNLEYLAAAFASGSSNGSAVSTSASFASFGMGEETVSSGRSPASNNGLVAYTPSRGYISIRGNWPLYPTCDVIVPHTRTVDDMLTILDVITAKDGRTTGDFWRHQNLVPLPEPWTNRPKSFRELRSQSSLQGLRIAVPQMYIGGSSPPNTTPVTTSPAVMALWEQAKADLESLGATVVLTPDFPLVTKYEEAIVGSSEIASDIPQLPKGWISVERGPLIAHAWDEFLRTNEDPVISSLSAAESEKIFPPPPPDDPQMMYTERGNAIHWSQLVNYLQDDSRSSSKSSLYSTPNLAEALHTLEDMRKVLLEDWLQSLDCDIICFPAAGDVGKADSDINHDSARYAWQNGVKFSNGNRALRHCGVPSVTVSMGIIPDKGMPVGLTFVGRGYDDLNLLKWAYAYEQRTKRRVQPGLTPALKSDIIEPGKIAGEQPLKLEIEECRALPVDDHADLMNIKIIGKISTKQSDVSSSLKPILELFVDAVPVPSQDITLYHEVGDGEGPARWRFEIMVPAAKGPKRDPREQTEAEVARDKTMIVVLARNETNGRPKGWLGLI